MKTLSINIMDKEFQVACPDGEEEALLRSARYLHEQMNEIRSTGKVVGLDRVAIMAALNITNALLSGNQSTQANEDITARRLRSVNDRLASALDTEATLKP